MKTITLIELLQNIDNKLKNNFYEHVPTNELSCKIPKYSLPELEYIREQKIKIITKLYNKKIISEKEWREFYLSEDDTFPPQLILNNNNE